MRIPIIKPMLDKYKPYILDVIGHIIDSGMFSNVNEFVKVFEEKVSGYLDSPVVAVSSCTSGLMLVLEALGIRKKEVIIPSFTFPATAAAVKWTNNEIVYADVDQHTFTIDRCDVEEKITNDTGAIIGVHIYGNPCDITELCEIADKYDVNLIFDGAHALGSKYDGEPVGSQPDATVFSLSPTKLLTTMEGGIIATDEDLVEKLKKMRNYGLNPDYTCDLLGLNARMSEIHAAIGLTQVKDLDRVVQNRNEYAKLYEKGLRELERKSIIRFQTVFDENLSTYKDFSIVLERDYNHLRWDVMNGLESKGIQTRAYFFPPVHVTHKYRDKTARLPITELVSDGVISLPIHNYMDEKVIEEVCNAIVEIVSSLTV